MKLFRMGVVVAFLLTLVFANYASGQSLTTGGISGHVTDPAGAVVPSAAVSLKNLDTGEQQATTTGADGTYRFNLLKPARYEVTVTVAGFAKVVQSTTVTVGQTADLSVVLEISKTAETIEVSAAAPLVSTEPGVATSYTPEEVALLPTPGGDLTTLAFTAPGVVVAQGSGYGNFTANGLPGTSNLYTVNGENDMDPYFNINNSGATNLTLGSNEVQEVTITTNPYSGQYGQLSGAQVSYVTKSGTNAYHGNAQWYWNGRNMNANDFFNNATDTPRAFSNANQWAASIGGPVIKDHTWFFVDTEGLRFILPNDDTETIPTPAFASAVLNNVGNLNPNESAAYQNMFSIYSNASAGKQVTPLPVGSVASGDQCATISLPGFAPGTPCYETFTSTPTSFAKEWILAGRIDQKVTSKDDVFFRFKIDHGLQPTAIDGLDPAFDANSNQPAWDYQVNWHRVISANSTNSFTATLSHYVAQFAQDVSKWQSAFPYGGVTFGGDVGLSSINGSVGGFPQGRNITQYQFIDDISWTRGKHSLKFGANFRRYDVSDHNFFYTYPTTYFADLTSTTLNGGNGYTGLQAFSNGVGNAYYQQDSASNDVPIGIWGVGFYVEDQWKVTSNFSVMGALRFEKNANPVCQTNCFANFNTSYPNLASVTSASPGDVPYSDDIKTGIHSAYPGVDAINVSPRLSFSWAPAASDHFPFLPGGNKTIISGGIGIFYDNPAAGMLDNLLGNPPSSVLFYISPLDSNFGSTGILPFDSSNPSSGPNAFKAASAAFNINDSYNQLSNILNPIIGYNPPISITSIQGTIHSPQVQEWNLKVDQEISKSAAISVSYNGNHSIHIPYFNDWWNVSASAPFISVPGVNQNPVPNYGTVKTLQSGAVSNYNGLTTSLRIQHHSWFLAHFNYTFSHALDETSNGGLFPIGGWAGGSNVQTQINPGSLRANNYGNADYDIRHLFNGDYVITPATHFENKFAKAALGGWQWSGKVFLRSGLPYTVPDGFTSSSLVNGGYAIADITSAGANQSCGRGAAYTNANPHPCLNANAFATNITAYTAYPNQTRNQFRGPDYFDFDMGLYKTFQIKERMNFGLGATAFNVFNHPNFNLPVTTLGSPLFGQIVEMQGVPTSPYGNFLGFDSSVRVVQLSLKLNF
jgi:outer membrane receptor protein involved in Fe transport